MIMWLKSPKADFNQASSLYGLATKSFTLCFVKPILRNASMLHTLPSNVSSGCPPSLFGY